MNARLLNLLSVVVATVAVAACGGGDGSGSPNPPPNVAPLAAFSASPSSGTAPLTVHFDASASSDADGTITGYAWTFGDGSTAMGSRVTSHLYSIAGSITVTLTVTDDRGATASTSHQVTIAPPSNAPPVASFTVTPSTGSVPLTVQFDGSASTDPDGSIVSYSWNFGDGASASDPQFVSHLYTIARTFTVTLTVTDDRGATHWTTRQVSVTAVQPLVGVALDAPTNFAVVPDAVSVVAAVWSTHAVREVTAEAGGSQVVLAYDPAWVGPPGFTPSPRYVGTVSLAGRPVGPYTLTVRATDVQDNSAEATVNVTHDNPPVLTVAAPVDLSVTLGSSALGKVAFDARCTDDVPGCTVQLRIDGQLHSSAPDVLVGSADLAPRVGAYVFEFHAIGGGSTGLTIEKSKVYVEDGARLSVVSQVEGAIRDADEQRLLSVESEEGRSDVLAIYDRVTGLTERIALPADRYVLTAYLIPGGALAECELRGSTLYPRLFLWRKAALTDLGEVVRGESLAVDGKYATWISGTDLYLWNTDEPNPSVISDEAWTTSVAADGTVVFGDSSWQIVRYRDGLQTTLTDGNPNYENSSPLTDGDGAVFDQRDLANDKSSLVLIDGDTAVVLDEHRDVITRLYLDYQLRGGWAAFTKWVSRDLFDVYTRSPDGLLLRHTSPSAPCQFADSYSGIERLAGNGEVMILCSSSSDISNWHRWFSRGNGLVPVSANAPQLGSYFLGGSWYVAIGSTFLAVDTSD